MRALAFLLAIYSSLTVDVVGFSTSPRVFVSTPVSNFPKRFVKDCMSPAIHVLHTDMSVDETMTMFLANNLGGAPVVDEHNKPIGIVTRYDFLQKEAFAGALLPIEGSPKNVKTYVEAAKKICGQKVEDVMTMNPTTIPETLPLNEAAAVLIERKFQRLPVVNDKGQLVGILTSADVMRDLLHVVRNLPPSKEDEEESGTVSP